MNEDYQLSPSQIEWARKRKQDLSPAHLKELVLKQKGRCALSGARMIFGKEYGTPKINTAGCHPLYAAVDHISPSNQGYGHQLVCYDLNDLKGHLPNKLFTELQNTSAWKHLMQQWKSQAENNPMDIDAFKVLLKD